MTFRVPIAAVYMLVLLCACSGGAEDRLDNYLTRLGRALDEPVSIPAEPTWERLPRARELRLKVSGGSIDLLDMLALQGCALQVTIGKMNSSLGKVAPDSQRLLLDLEFLALAPDCIAELNAEGNHALVKQLSTAWQDKRDQLPRRIWNAVLAGPEMRSFWKRPRQLADYPGQTGYGAALAMEYIGSMIDRWYSGDYSADGSKLEQALADLRGGDGGALLWTMQLQSEYLEAATAAVQRRSGPRPLCVKEQTTPQARIVETVVLQYFVADVQTWLVQLQQRRRKLSAATGALEVQLESVMPATYRDWRGQRDARLAYADGAARRHVEALGPLLAACGLRPGA